MRQLARFASIPACAALLLSGCAGKKPPEPDPVVGACAAQTLSIKRVGGDAGMGHRTLAFSFTNTSDANCTLRGYASVAPLTRAGQLANTINVTHAHGDYLNASRTVQTLTLPPGQQAWFEMGYTVIPSRNGACPQVETLRISAPGTSNGSDFKQPMAPCDGIEVLPLHAGPPEY